MVLKLVADIHSLRLSRAFSHRARLQLLPTATRELWLRAFGAAIYFCSLVSFLCFVITCGDG